MKRIYMLDVGTWNHDLDDKWGEIKEKDIITQYMRLTKDFKKENKNVVWVSGNYTKFLDSVNNNLLFYWYIVLDIDTKNIILEDDAGNNLNNYFEDRRGLE